MMIIGDKTHDRLIYDVVFLLFRINFGRSGDAGFPDGVEKYSNLGAHS